MILNNFHSNCNFLVFWPSLHPFLMEFFSCFICCLTSFLPLNPFKESQLSSFCCCMYHRQRQTCSIKKLKILFFYHRTDEIVKMKTLITKNKTFFCAINLNRTTFYLRRSKNVNSSFIGLVEHWPLLFFISNFNFKLNGMNSTLFLYIFRGNLLLILNLHTDFTCMTALMSQGYIVKLADFIFYSAIFIIHALVTAAVLNLIWIFKMRWELL
jgi:hypothetical protein